MIEMALYGGFIINQALFNGLGTCTLPPDNQLEDPEGAFDKDEGLLAGAIQWSAIDIHQLITSPHLLGQGCLASIFNLLQRTKQKAGREGTSAL